MSQKQPFSEKDLKKVSGGSIPPPEKPSLDSGDGGSRKPVQDKDLRNIAGGGDPKGTRGIPAPTPEGDAAGGKGGSRRTLSPDEAASVSGGGDPRGTRGIDAPQDAKTDDRSGRGSSIG